jgi:indolepyruvate ferredoxin oxidoreductase alpha subunit
MWDAKAQKSRIDEAICVGCGVCAQVCRHGAIMLKPLNAAQGKDS